MEQKDLGCQTAFWFEAVTAKTFFSKSSDRGLLHLKSSRTALCLVRGHSEAHSPMDEVLLLQILHGRGDLSGHVKQHNGSYLLTAALPEIVKQIPIWHVLGHNVKRRLQGTHT